MGLPGFFNDRAFSEKQARQDEPPPGPFKSLSVKSMTMGDQKIHLVKSPAARVFILYSSARMGSVGQWVYEALLRVLKNHMITNVCYTEAEVLNTLSAIRVPVL